MFHQSVKYLHMNFTGFKFIAKHRSYFGCDLLLMKVNYNEETKTTLESGGNY